MLDNYPAMHMTVPDLARIAEALDIPASELTAAVDSLFPGAESGTSEERGRKGPLSLQSVRPIPWGGRSGLSAAGFASLSGPNALRDGRCACHPPNMPSKWAELLWAPKDDWGLAQVVKLQRSRVEYAAVEVAIILRTPDGLYTHRRVSCAGNDLNSAHDRSWFDPDPEAVARSGHADGRCRMPVVNWGLPADSARTRAMCSTVGRRCT